MKDNIQELADLLQLLNVNDGRMDPSDNDWRYKYFPKMTSDEIGTQITDEMINGIKKLARGYVSYVKSNNPITFPKPLNPPAELLYEPSHDEKGRIRPLFPYRGEDPTEDVSAGYDITLPNNTPFKFDLVKCPMSVYQFKCYVEQMKGTHSDSSDTHTRMASNIVFPHPEMNRFVAGGTIANLQTVYGNKGFDACFRKQTIETADKKKFTFYQYTSSALNAAGNFLKQGETGLEIFSKKFDIFLNCINDGPKGVVYAYSEFVKAGALMGALVLEANGYVRFTPSLKNHIDKTTGLPVNNIEKIYPQAHILHLTGEHSRKPQTHYRCALCGKVYDQCRLKHKADHPFKIATYILVTAAIGNIADIAEATSGNKDGSKIRVVMGTKTTGQGVDFKWVRQVHILDPWHNNTRIYQAIGRGLRHCSHADLPPNERDVTIYKYASAPASIDITGHAMDDEVKVEQDGKQINLKLTYRDFYTETVDEHMYQRVVRKDLIIKQIERILKIVAVDCELNRMRNQFPTDVDYSRECDYTLCKYTCDGFVTPIKYIRKIRRDASNASSVKWFIVDDNDDVVAKDNLYQIEHLLNLLPLKRQAVIKSNEDLWQALKKGHYLLKVNANPSVEELLVDVPLIKIDSSTYDIYFSAPQVDRAMKLITRIYQKSIAHTMEKLTFLVKQTDPTLDDQYVYMAMDKLVGNPPTIKPVNFVDRYGRNGYIVYHNGYYIYQPVEIKDKTTPLFYRMRPLEIKRRFYNMDQLAPKAKAVTYTVSSMDTERLDTLVNQYMSKNMRSVINLLDMFRIFNGLMLQEHKYIVETVINNIYTSPDPPATNGALYIIEYYLRTGLLIFRGWKRTNDNMERLLDRKDQDMTPMHFISADGNARVYERLSGGWSWTSQDLSDVRVYLSEPDTARYYPAPPTFNDSPPVAKPVFPNLNINDSDGIYAFRSGNVTRDNKPIISEGELPTIMVNVVDRLSKNYPDVKAMGLNSFKVVDETTKQETITKAATRSGRTKLRGLACLSAQETTTKPQIERVFTAINDNYASMTENVPMQQFWQLAELGNLRDRKALCRKLETLMMIADYYYIGGVKWNLNTLETEFYRPSVLKAGA